MPILFYSTRGEYGAFSNFSRHPVRMSGRLYPTSEHYFQSQKFAGTKYETEVARAKGPAEAAAIGRDRSLPLRKDWESAKDNVMRAVVYAKFTQHKTLTHLLLSTGDERIIEHTERDSYWGDGGNGSGKNMLGQILMETRERIRRENHNKSKGK